MARLMAQINEEQKIILKRDVENILMMQNRLSELSCQVNDEPKASLKMAEDTNMMGKGLSEQSRQVYRMWERVDKQRKHLTDLQTYMEEWGAKEEDVTRQLSK